MPAYVINWLQHFNINFLVKLFFYYLKKQKEVNLSTFIVHIFWEGHKILRNLHHLLIFPKLTNIPRLSVWNNLKGVLGTIHRGEESENVNFCLFSVRKTCLHSGKGVQKSWKCAYIVYERSLNVLWPFIANNTCDDMANIKISKL